MGVLIDFVRADALANDDCVSESCMALAISDVHLFSVGGKNLLTEFWADPVTESISVRVTQSTASSTKVLAHKQLDLKVPCGHWNHLVVNCTQLSSQAISSGRLIRIKAVLNGLKVTSLDLDLAVVVPKRSYCPSFMLVGMARDPCESYRSSWYLGHVSLYRAPVLTQEIAIVLMALGPDCLFLAGCPDDQLTPNLAAVLSAKLVAQPLDWDRIFQPQKSIELLQVGHNLIQLLGNLINY